MTKVYLDNAIVAALARGQGGPDEEAALEKVLEAAGPEKRLNLVTSPVTAEEIAEIPEEHRPPHRAIYQLLSRVPMAEELGLNLFLVLPALPVRPHPLLVQLRKFLAETDARHVFQAIRNGADVFLTLDGGIIHHRKTLTGLGIKVLKPPELAVETSL
jgi:hypothetical protein